MTTAHPDPAPGAENGPDGVRPHRRLDALAFYLPQYHPIPENDEWWGKGFTEWTNVSKARPLFPGHYQPDLPGELGFTDLRVPEVREAQANLAGQHGITAFCYWHYWFAGRQILDRPFREVLASGTPEFPFCLAWANQSWTGKWHGDPGRTLIEQTYPGYADHVAHFEEVLPAFQDRRYFTVDGKPLFYVFRPEELPDPAGFVDCWRSLACDAGLPGLYLVAEVASLSGTELSYTSVAADGFDAAVYVRIPARINGLTVRGAKAIERLFGGPEVYPYSTDAEVPRRPLPAPFHPCVIPNWDNTPRSGRRGFVLQGASPARFGEKLRANIELARADRSIPDLVFLKSWNEWAEGNHLEPDRRFGRGYLEALAKELEAARRSAGSDHRAG